MSNSSTPDSQAEPTIIRVSRFASIGPTNAYTPCDREHPHPEIPYNNWHDEEIQRIVNLWMRNNPGAIIERVDIRKSESERNSIQLIADISYKITEEAESANKIQQAEQHKRDVEAWEARQADREAKRLAQERTVAERLHSRICTQCGKPLSFFQKLLGKTQHADCFDFTQ